jgi:hypothetical protein
MTRRLRLPPQSMPPEEHRYQPGWHRVETPAGTRLLAWEPGLRVWREGGQVWTAETAACLAWRYIGPKTD